MGSWSGRGLGNHRPNQEPTSSVLREAHTRPSRVLKHSLTGTEGNHGEDVKEYWWFLDSVPSHVWNSWRYHYPQRAFPYQQLLDENRRRGKLDPEYELLDTGIFDDDRYWIVDVSYAKADPTDVLMSIRVTNAGPQAELLHVLPTMWFRNTWSWDSRDAAPTLAATVGGSVAVDHPFLGKLELLAGTAPDGTEPQLLFCDNETNRSRLYGVRGRLAQRRHQRPCRLWRPHRESRTVGEQMCGVVPHFGWTG